MSTQTTITFDVSPTGGCIVLEIMLDPTLDMNTTNIVIQRYTGSLSATPQTLFSGLYTDSPLVVDDGMQMSNHLDFGTTYFYTVTDPNGTVTTPGIVPASTLIVTPSYIDKLLFRLFTAGIKAVSTPAGVTPGSEIRVLQAMSLAKGDVMPFIVMNLDLEQQREVPIGRAVVSTFGKIWTIPSIVFKQYSVWILTRSAVERDFYKDACIGVLLSIMTNVMERIGSNISYSYQAAQSQVVSPEPEFSPGFYEADVHLDIEGTFNISIEINQPLIESIVYGVSGIVDTTIPGTCFDKAVTTGSITLEPLIVGTQTAATHTSSGLA